MQVPLKAMTYILKTDIIINFPTLFLFSTPSRSNWTVTDILCPRHWFFIDFYGIRNYIQQFVLINTELARRERMAEGDSGQTCLYLPLQIVQDSPGFAADIGKLIICT